MDKFLLENFDSTDSTETILNNELELDLKELTQVKERKMLFDRGFSDNFEQKEESKIYAVREKAYILKQKANSQFISEEGAKIFVKNQIKKLENEWPALFGRECNEIFIHVDLDSFYASVETLLNPSYKDKPLVVGSINMIAACNYKAREYGIRSGMPGYQAKELCPEVIITKTNFDKYNFYSEIVMEILSSYDSEIEIYGIDEACLMFNKEKLLRAYDMYNSKIIGGILSAEPVKCSDFTFKNVDFIIEQIRNEIRVKTGLTISAGISVCRGLAKFSSKINKPNGQYSIEKDFDSHILNLEVDEINGIGKFTKELLNKSLNIKFIKELRNKLYMCFLIFKPKTFDNLLRLSFGLSLFDSKGLKNRINAKSKSHGVEMSIKPITEYSEILFYIWNFSNALESRVRKSKKPGMTVTLSIKYTNFNLITKRRKTNTIFQNAVDIFNCSVELLKECLIKKEYSGEYVPALPIRMLGLRISDLVDLRRNQKLELNTKQKSKYKDRKCVICGEYFINEADINFQMHVNRCIDNQEKNKNIKKDNNLKTIFRFGPE